MLPTIATGNVASAIGSGYDVANSCRFNSGDSAYLSKTFSDGGSSRKTFTLSYWIKRTDLGNEILFGGAGGDAIYFTGTDELLVAIGSGTDDRRESDMKFRDVGAWYHIVQKFDTTQGTAADRYTLYVNGTVATTNVVSGKNDITEDDDIDLFYGGASYIGFDGSAYGSYYLSEMVHIDGSALAASSFGEFDEDSPAIWKPKDISGLTFGTNGFYLDFEDSGDLGDDESGETNDFTENNIAAVDQVADSPTNNWCVMNPLDNYYAGSTFSRGNLKIVTASGTRTWVRSTFGVNTGKWYWEQRLTVASTDSAEDDVVGIVDSASTAALLSLDSSSSCPGLVLRENGKIFTYLSGSSGETAGWGEFEDDDIVRVALDLDNNKIYFGTNDTWGNSSDPGAGSDGFAITHASSGGHDDFWYCAVSILNNNSSNTWDVNFGCPTFTISSSNADDDGYGNFEYDVPAGFFSLCSKNLAEYGG